MDADIVKKNRSHVTVKPAANQRDHRPGGKSNPEGRGSRTTPRPMARHKALEA